MMHKVLDFVRVTEAAAIAASGWIGTGDKLNADKAATDAMRDRLNHVPFSGKIVIGEGKKDNSYGLFSGDRVGEFRNSSAEQSYELAVDPIEGTRPTVTSGPEAISVLAIAEEKALFHSEEFYMHKLAYSSEIAQRVDLDINAPIEEIIRTYSDCTGKEPSRIVVCLLDRDRHTDYVTRLRKIGVRTKLIQDCDVSGAIATCLPESGIDLLYGVGGTPESVISACAMKCLKGGYKAQIASADGKVLDKKVYTIDDMVKGDCAFAATGITNGSLLRGVRFTSRGPVTNSVVMRSSTGTVRWLTAYHGN